MVLEELSVGVTASGGCEHREALPGSMAGLASWRRRVLAAALLLTALLRVAHGVTVAGETSSAASDDTDLDEESDLAPFAVVVEHGAGGRGAAWYCGGSLVSLRTVLTSRWCARGGELAVLAAAVVPAQRRAARHDGVRRVSRVVFASEFGYAAAGDIDDVISDGSWAGASLDLALLQLESPFGAKASARPILMATEATECAFPNDCHAAGVQPRGVRALLRVVDLEMVRPDTCAASARHWPSTRDRALCLTGAELCSSDRGAGVVCGGKLCGVLSRSAGGARRACGRTHVAQSVALWRRFLQCAHTAGSCRRDTECTKLCAERQLLPEAEVELEAQLMGRPSPAMLAAVAPPAAPTSPLATQPVPPRAEPEPSTELPDSEPTTTSSTSETSLVKNC